MTKEDFTNALKYGVCEGSVEAVSPKCVDGSPGNKPEPCPYKLIENRGRGIVKPCNCCAICRNNCNWMAQIKKVSKRESMESLQKIKQMVEDYNNE